MQIINQLGYSNLLQTIITSCWDMNLYNVLKMMLKSWPLLSLNGVTRNLKNMGKILMVKALKGQEI